MLPAQFPGILVLMLALYWVEGVRASQDNKVLGSQMSARELQAVHGQRRPTSKSSADDSGYRLSDWYLEGSSGSWLMWDRGQGLGFQDRYPLQQMLRASALALSTAALRRVPEALGYNTSGILTKAALTLPSFLLPGYYLYRNREALLRQPQSRDTPIFIADQHSLAERLSLRFRQSDAGQSLIFRLPPVKLIGLPINGLKASLPMTRLARLMIALNSDELELYWPEGSSVPELRTVVAGQHLVVIEVPGWSAFLREQSLKQQSQKQKLPALLLILQHAGLQEVNEMMACLLETTLTPGSCDSGTLISLHEGSSFREDSSVDQNTTLTEMRFVQETRTRLKPVHTRKLGQRVVTGLPPCQTNNRCAMTLTTQDLPQSGLLLYTKPVSLQTLPQPLPSAIAPMIYTLSPLQTDMLTLLPYAATWLLANSLLNSGMQIMGLTDPQITASAAGSGLLGWISLPALGRLGPGGSDGSGGGGAPGSGKLRNSGTPASVLHMEAALLKALPAPSHVQTQLYKEVQEAEPALEHQGNNCFFNSAMSFYNNMLTDEQLNDIDNDRFNAASRLYTESDSDTFRKSCHTRHAQLRKSFTRLMRAMTHARVGGVTKAAINRHKLQFYRNARSFSDLPRANSFKTILSSIGMSGLLQEDPDELINIISTTFGLHLDPGRTIKPGIAQEYTINDKSYQRKSWEPGAADYIRIALPSPQQVRSQHIRNINDLLNQHHLAREKITEDNKVFLSPTEAAQMGVTDQDILKHGRNMTPYQSPIIGHKNPDELEHLNIQAKIFRHTDNQVAKIRTVTRRLLAGGGTITIPVINLSNNNQHKVRMHLQSLVMHRGDEARSGHYISAVRRGNDWYIHDDMATHVIKLVPQKGASTSSLELLLNYMEQNSLDPYLFHFSR